VINSNLPPILHRSLVLADYWSNFRYRRGDMSLTLTLPLGVIPANIRINFTFPETRRINNCSTRCCKPHDRIFIRLDKTSERDGRTDRRTELL